MAGRKGRSGPPANLNAAKRPWDVFFRRRALRQADRWLVAVMEDYAGALASDKPDASEAEKLMMQNAQVARGAAMLILAECQRRGFIRDAGGGTWDVQPGVKELSRFLGAERQALQALGLERRTKAAPSLAEYLSRRYDPDAVIDAQASTPQMAQPEPMPVRDDDGEAKVERIADTRPVGEAPSPAGPARDSSRDSSEDDAASD